MGREMENIKNKLLKDKNRLIPTIDSIDTVTISVGAIIDRFYSNQSTFKTTIKSINDRTKVFKYWLSEFTTHGDSLKSLEQETINLIDNIISEIEYLGLPSTQDKKIDKSIKIKNVLYQNQEQSQNVNLNFVIEAIRNELTGKQFKEIENIIQQEPNIEKAKPKIIEKLNSFGENLLSSMLANVLTNPAIWSLFFDKMVGV